MQWSHPRAAALPPETWSLKVVLGLGLHVLLLWSPHLPKQGNQTSKIVAPPKTFPLLNIWVGGSAFLKEGGPFSSIWFYTPALHPQINPSLSFSPPLPIVLMCSVFPKSALKAGLVQAAATDASVTTGLAATTSAGPAPAPRAGEGPSVNAVSNPNPGLLLLILLLLIISSPSLFTEGPFNLLTLLGC